MSARSASSTAGIALQRRGPRVQADVARRRVEQRRIVQEAAEHRAHAQPAQQRRLGPGRVEPGGDDRPAGGSDENVRAYGFGSIGIPYLRCRPGAPSASFASSPGSSVNTIIGVRQCS